MYSAIVSSANHPDPYNPYLGLFNYRSIKSLSGTGVNVNTVSLRPVAPPIGPYSEYREIPAKYSYDTHQVHYPRFPYLIPQKVFKFTLSSLAARRALGSYLEANFEQPDVCHAGHIHYDGTALVPYCREHGIPLTVMGRGKLLNNYHDMSFAGRRRVRKTLQYADRVLCVSGSLAEIAETIVDDSKVSVLPNGADPSRYPTSRKLRLREELGIPGDATVLLFCGGYTERKGIHEIIEGLDDIRHDDVRLVFVGHYGDLRTKLIDALEATPHDGYQVLWQVPPVALRRWFTVADVLMIPSHAEGRPNTVYEAMASETAVVGSAVSGIPEQVVDGETGILIPPKDPDALTSALNELIENDTLRQEMGQAGLQRLRSEGWTWEAHAQQLKQVHESLLQS